MKGSKIFMMLFVFMVCVIFTSSAMAVGPTSGSWHGTYYDVGANYSASGNCFATGGNKSVVKPAEGGDFNISDQNFEVNGAYSCQKVKSKAWAAGSKTKTEVYGTACQYSGAEAVAPNNNWAQGYQDSSAYYYGKSRGRECSFAKGSAKTCGGSIAGAASFTRGNTNIGMAGAAVGSCGTAHVTARNRRIVGVEGYGRVAHQSYASRGTGEAWTYGSASYEFERQRHASCISNCGFAATGGISTVTTRPNGAIVAESHSISISSCGSASTGGGSYISSLR